MKLTALALVLCLCIGMAPAVGAAGHGNAGGGTSVDVDVQKIDSATADLFQEGASQETLDYGEEPYEDDDVVRAIIFLEEAPVLQAETRSNMVLSSGAALGAKKRIDAEQQEVQRRIEKNVLQGEPLEVVD